MDEKINIVLIFDKNLSSQAKVTIGSVIYNTSSDLNFIIYVDSYLYKTVDALSYHTFFSHLLSNGQEISFNFKEMTDKPLQHFSNQTPLHITKTTLYRLNLQELYLDNINYCIYLDVDLIVNLDISKLYEQRIAIKYLGASIEQLCKNYKYSDEFSYQQNMQDRDRYIYVNAGVLLINIKSWYENNILEKFKNSAKSICSFSKYGDQDILNDTFRIQTNIIENKYNYLATFFDKLPCNDNIFERELIIHYTGPNKPWNKSELVDCSATTQSFIAYCRYIKLVQVQELYFMLEHLNTIFKEKLKYSLKRYIYIYLLIISVSKNIQNFYGKLTILK